jgi:sec-independent protein translocase protein TatA
VFGAFGPMEVALVLFLLLILFGAKRIPGLARSVGEGIRNFRSGIKEPDRLNGDGGEERDDRGTGG